MPKVLCACSKYMLRVQEVVYWVADHPCCNYQCYNDELQRETLRSLERRERATRDMGV